MSGIFGVFRFDGGEADGHVLTLMGNSLSHRGPDGETIWKRGPVGLGHLMLHTTAESLHEYLPLESEDGTFCITADARIDNREDLFRELELDQRAGFIPDSSLILAAYQRWGNSCVDHLLGDFAFVVRDVRRNSIFCARDHMGVKPLYYWHSTDLFAFASEIKALFCLPGVLCEINETTIAFRLVGMEKDHKNTSFRRILRLPSASTMEVNPSGAEMKRFWSLDSIVPKLYETDEEYLNAFRKIFNEAVRCRLRSAFPVGSELSGGLDSSSIACTAREILRDARDGLPNLPLHTFSAVFEEVPECDERHYIKKVLSLGGFEPHFINPDCMSPLTEIDERLWHQEEPTILPTSYTYWNIYKLARNAGIRVLLSGEWGDVVVSHGSRSLYEFASSGKWITLVREIDKLSKNLDYPRRFIIWHEFIVPNIPSFIGASLKTKHKLRWIRKELAKQTGLFHFMQEEHKYEKNLNDSRKHHRHSFESVPVQMGLESMDKNAAAHAVEARYPFLDRRVVEFCLSLPPQMRIHNGYTRAIEREALSLYLPEEISSRAKKTMADPYLVYAIRKFDSVRIKSILVTNQQVFEEFINEKFISGAYDRMIKGLSQEFIPLWRTSILSFWLTWIERLKRSGSFEDNKKYI